MGQPQNKIHILLGPTSIGKTSLAIKLCKKTNGEIISADSRQVVKFMDIGTGKMPINATYPIQKHDHKWVLNNINVWGYDLTTPDKYFSGVNWTSFAIPKANEILKKGKSVYVVGGTGFYIDLFTGNKRPAQAKPDFELRKSLEIMSDEELLRWLTSLNLETAKRIDTKNRVRIIRALEIELKKEKEKTTPLPRLENYSRNIIGLTGPRDLLYIRVDTWTDAIWKNGLLSEVGMLLDMGFSQSPKLQGLVYKTAMRYIENKISKEGAIQRTKYDLHAYIRRQQTYFKKIPNVEWFDISTDDCEEKIYTVVNG